LIFINIIVFGGCLTLYACQNISAQDFGPDDIVNMLEVILKRDNYTTNAIDEDNIEIIDNADNTGMAESPTEPFGDSSQPDSNEHTNTTEIPEIIDTAATTEIITEITNPPVAPTEPDTTAAVTENITETAQTTERPGIAQIDDINLSPYYSSGVATGTNILNVFPGAPQKFVRIAFPESVPLTDSLKKNIKDLAGFSPRDYKGLSFYIATTKPELFTPKYGGGMLSDARRYRTELVDVECNAIITSPNTFLEKSKETIINDIRIAMQTDEFVADILCLPFDIQSELIKHGLLMNLKKTPFLNVNAEYYNASATEAFTVNGNIFGLVSDLTFDPSTVYAVYYNKTLVKKYNLSSPIELYKNGKWDYDGMFDISKELTAAAADLDIPAGAVYSIGIDKESNDVINGLFISSGSKYFTVRPYNYPAVNFSNEKTLNFIDTVSKIFSPSWESGMTNFLNSGESVQTDAFKNGNILFSVSKLDIIPSITDSDFDWGILPVPALNGDYDVRFSSTDRDALCISILKGTRNTEACGIITSALSAVSHRQLKDIYVLEQMRFHLRDIDSVMVLGDIIDNIGFNQYDAFSTMPEIYSSTAGILKDAANKRIDFSGTYENNRAMLNEFFRNSIFFARD